MDHPTKIYLDVPYEEKGQAKALGARWDARQRAWYAPDPSRLAEFDRWLPRWALDPGETIRLPVLILPTACYRCHRPIACVVGLALPTDADFQPSAIVGDLAFVAVADCDAVLGFLLALAAAGVDLTPPIGPLLHRQTEHRPDGYLANACPHCGSTQGAFPLSEEVSPDRVDELFSQGLEIDYPLAALPLWSAELDR